MNLRCGILLFVFCKLTLTQVPYLSSPSLLVHSLNQYNSPQLSLAIQQHRAESTKEYTSSLEILG